MKKLILASVALIALCGVARADKYDDLLRANAACNDHHALGGVYEVGFEACSRIADSFSAAWEQKVDEYQKAHADADRQAVAKALSEISTAQK